MKASLMGTLRLDISILLLPLVNSRVGSCHHHYHLLGVSMRSFFCSSFPWVWLEIAAGQWKHVDSSKYLLTRTIGGLRPLSN